MSDDETVKDQLSTAENAMTRRFDAGRNSKNSVSADEKFIVSGVMSEVFLMFSKAECVNAYLRSSVLGLYRFYPLTAAA